MYIYIYIYIYIIKGHCICKTNDKSANCQCEEMSGQRGSTYSGSFCECCEKGECKKKCDPYIGAKSCFGRGTCNCDVTCEVCLSLFSCLISSTIALKKRVN